MSTYKGISVYLSKEIDRAHLGNSCKFVQFPLSRNRDSTHLFGSNERVPVALHEQTFVNAC